MTSGDAVAPSVSPVPMTSSARLGHRPPPEPMPQPRSRGDAGLDRGPLPAARARSDRRRPDQGGWASQDDLPSVPLQAAEAPDDAQECWTRRLAFFGASSTA